MPKRSICRIFKKTAKLSRGSKKLSFFFIQMSDTQLGMAATLSGPNNKKRTEMHERGLQPPQIEISTGFAYETERFEKAICAANRLKPKFIVVTGDLIQDPEDLSQLNELQRITNTLNPNIKIHMAPGNCDVGNSPTAKLLSLYRERFGDDNYSFDHGMMHFVVINTSIAFDPTHVPQEWEAQLGFLKTDLARATKKGQRCVVFGHHPLFGETRDDPDSQMVIPIKRRRIILDLFEEHHVEAMFSGHWHKNKYSSDDGFRMIISGPVGVPLGPDPSGIRIIKVFEKQLDDTYYGFESVPDFIEIE